MNALVRRTPGFLAGRLRCMECRESWYAVWNTRAPALACHECGGHVVPIGLQLVEGGSEDSEMYRIQRRAVFRTMS